MGYIEIKWMNTKYTYTSSRSATIYINCELSSYHTRYTATPQLLPDILFMCLQLQNFYIYLNLAVEFKYYKDWDLKLKKL